MYPAQQTSGLDYDSGAGNQGSRLEVPARRAADGAEVWRYPGAAAALLPVMLLWLCGFGAHAGFSQTVSFDFFSTPNLVANTGLSEELGEIVLLAGPACGTAADALCISAAGSIQVTYTDMVFENTSATGITVCETLSGVTVCNTTGTFLSGSVSLGSTAQGSVVSFGIRAGANFATGDQVRISGVRARIDQTPLATPGNTASALLTVAPVAAVNFSPTVNLIARSADPLSLSAVTETVVPCAVGDSSAVLQITEEYATAFVDHGDFLETVFPGAPANARPLFGATGNTQIRLALEGLVPGISIQWPASVPAAIGGAMLDLVSQTNDGSEAIYVFGTPDQGPSDSTPEIFEIQLTSANFIFSGNDSISGHVRVQGQLLPPASPSTARPRYDHALEPVPGVLLLELRRCHITTGILQVFAQVDAIVWFGNLEFELLGPTPLSGSKVPVRLEGLQPGNYTMNYISGGPAGATFLGFPQPPTQTLGAGQTQVFAFSFSGPTIAQLELRSSPASVCSLADTVVGNLQLVNATEELQIIPAGARFSFTFSSPVVGPFVTAGPAQFTPAEVAGAAVSYELIDRVLLSPGEGLTFSGARLNLSALGAGQAVTVQFTTSPPSAILLSANQAAVAITDTIGCTPIPPTFTADGVTNAASLEAGISPGSIATLFGANLSSGFSGTLQAGSLPLPVELGGTSVTVDGIPAPLFAIANINGQEQISFQVPWELAQLGSPANPAIVVTRNGVSSAPVMVDLLAASPGIFTTDGTTGAILHGASLLPVTSSNPASAGETVILYAAGLGPVVATPQTGSASLADPFSETLETITVTVGGVQATVGASGLTPGLVGIYQVMIDLPVLISPDPLLQELDVVIAVSGITSKPVKLAVQALGGLAGP